MSVICPILDRATLVDKTDFCQGTWSIVRCRETGIVFLANPPETSKLEFEFAWERTSNAERKRRAAREPVVSRLSTLMKKTKFVISPKRNKIASIACELMQAQTDAEPLQLLDIGCGCGSLMLEIHQRFANREQKIVPVGIEVSRKLAKVSHERVAALGGEVICANAIDGVAKLQPESVHLVIMSSFLEHESRPLRLLRGLHKILASEGVVVLKVPNFACWNRVLRGRKWCGFRFPDHVNYFTPQTLQRLAQEARFTVVRQNIFDRFPLSDNMYAVLKKN